VNVQGIIEAALFAAGDGIESAKLAEIAGVTPEQLSGIIAEMESEYGSGMRGVKIIRVGTKYQMSTRDEYGIFVSKIVTPKIFKPLSAAAVEVLAIIAYKQPVTRQFIEKIRGVECKFSIIKLLERDLIEESGRVDAPGRPVLYSVTECFLRTFGLASLDELPPLSQFQTEALSAEEGEMENDDIMVNS
jgi:segregation and condensation protein B